MPNVTQLALQRRMLQRYFNKVRDRLLPLGKGVSRTISYVPPVSKYEEASELMRASVRHRPAQGWSGY